MPKIGIGPKIKALREHKRLTRDQFAAIMGVKPSKIQDIERQSQRTGDDFIIGLVEKFGIDLEWLFSGHIEHDPRGFFGTADGDEYAVIPPYRSPEPPSKKKASEGTVISKNYAFRRDWLQSLGISVKDAAMLIVPDNSMAPKVADGDVLLLDTARREPPVRPEVKGRQVRSGIYVVDVDGETRVKRVERPDFQNLILYSEDTTNYPPEAFLGRDQERLNFIGKVIWWGHTVDF